MRSRDGKFTVSKTAHDFWRVRFTSESGKRISKNCRTATERDNLIRAIRRGESLDFWFHGTEEEDRGGYSGTFRALADMWLDHGKSVRELSASCLSNYKAHLRHHILPVLGKIGAEKLSLRDIERLASELTTKAPQTKSFRAVRKNLELDGDDEVLSMTYRREILTVACMVTRWAHDRHLIAANPFEKFRLPEKAEQPYDYWSLEDEDKFLTWLEAGGIYHIPAKARGGRMFMKRMRVRDARELRDVTLFALRSGMRLGEIGALTNRNVNLAQGWVRVRASYSAAENRIKQTTKNKKFRYIEMNDDMREILEARRFVADDQAIFTIRMNSIKFFSRTCRWAQVKEIHFHALRHTCLTNLANGYGMDRPLPLPKVQQIAGHSEITTTMRYVHNDGIEGTSSLQCKRLAISMLILD